MRLPPPSLKRRLPVLIGALIFAGVTTFAILAYRTVRTSLLHAASARLTILAEQITPTLGGQFRALHAKIVQAASDPVFARQLAAGPGRTVAGAREALRHLDADTIGVLAVELRDTTGRVVLSVGRAGHLAAPNARVPGAQALDTTAMGPLYERDSTLLFEVRANVERDGHVIGQVAELRAATANAASLRMVSQLIGSDGALLLGNADGSLWTDLQTVIHRPPPGRGLVQYTRDSVPKLAVALPMQGTPLVLAFEFNADHVTMPLADLVRGFALVALLVVAIGALVGWWLSRGVTRPLIRLTLDAEAISDGNLGHAPAESARRDEIGRLTRAFGQMAVSVRESHNTLEHQVAARTAELRAAQEENVRRERLATLGQLSSSVGHELRNPLGVMANAVYFLSATLKDPTPKTTEYLGILRSQIGLSEKIVADLLDFARVKPPQQRPVTVRDIVDEQLNRTPIPAGVTVNRSDEAAPVVVDPVQVGQVVLNLLTNAAQAMEGRGGVLTIDTVRENGTVRLTVRDTGPGIAPEHLAQVFEPLFTTKARGIGLGLSVSRSLAQANGGQLTVVSEPGQGAAFTLDLPVAP